MPIVYDATASLSYHVTANIFCPHPNSSSPSTTIRGTYRIVPFPLQPCQVTNSAKISGFAPFFKRDQTTKVSLNYWRTMLH